MTDTLAPAGTIAHAIARSATTLDGPLDPYGA